MSEFIRAIEFDQTPTRAAMQWGSELADEANKKAQLSMTMQKMQAEREKALNDKYGEFQKMALDQVKGAKGELVDKMMSRFVESLGQALNESKGDIGVFTRLGFDKSLKGLIADRAASDQILAIGEELAKKNSTLGIDQEAVRAATAKYILTNLGSGLNPDKYAQFIQSEIDDNPSLYGDPAKQLEILKSAKSAKGDTLERKVTLDPTGTLKKVLDIKTERKPWEKIDVFKASNGVSTDLPRVTFETIDAPMDPAAKLVKGGVQFKSVTEDVYRNFLAQGPAVKSTVAAGAKDVVHSVNANQFGLDTRGLSRQEFQAAKEKYPYLVDPFNEGVLDVYGKHVVTKLIEGDYDKDGFKVPENLATELRKDNPPKTTNNTTINMPGAGGDGKQFIDNYSIIKDAVEKGPKIYSSSDKDKKRPIGTPLNMLESGQDYLIEIANKVGGKADEGAQKYNQENLILKKTPEGKIGLYQWDNNNFAVGKLVSVVSEVPTNVDANQPLGINAKAAAAGVTPAPKGRKKKQDPLGIL